MILGAASWPLEWAIRIGLAVAVVAIGVMLASHSHGKVQA
jgi:hypothetical protein